MSSAVLCDLNTCVVYLRRAQPSALCQRLALRPRHTPPGVSPVASNPFGTLTSRTTLSLCLAIGTYHPRPDAGTAVDQAVATGTGTTAARLLSWTAGRSAPPPARLHASLTTVRAPSWLSEKQRLHSGCRLVYVGTKRFTQGEKLFRLRWR